MTMRKIISFVTISALVLSLSGCFGAILGAAAGGAGVYYTKKEIDKSENKKLHAIKKKTRIEERENFSRKVKENVDKDKQISLGLSTKMLGGGLTKILSINAIVKDGVVTLYGNAPSQTVVNRAIDMARREPGVKRVVNNLVVVKVKIIAPEALQRSVSAVPVPLPSSRKTMEENIRSGELERKISALEAKGKKNQKALEENPLVMQLKKDGTLQKHNAFEKAMQEMQDDLSGANNSDLEGLTLPARP